MYLPDTNIFILGLRGHEPEASFLVKAISQNKLVISVVAMGEFLAKADGEIEVGFLRLLEKFRILSIDQDDAQIAAEYRKQGFKTKRVHLLDCFLAAQAKINHLTLVTNDKSDFPMRDIRIITPQRKI